jgi:hypothetical protein
MTADASPELQVLAKKLLRLPTTEPPATAQTVYGYVRTRTAQPAYVDACADLLTWWSRAIGLRLDTVFRDNGVASTALVRPGLTGLLDVLRLTDSASALIIESTHVSDIRRTGSTVRILTDELNEVTA